MKKYIEEAGYQYVKDYNDLIRNQFALVGVSYSSSETSTLNGYKFDRTESYIMFLSDLSADTFKTKLESIIQSAINDGVDVSAENSITVENVENGFNVTMDFFIRG